MITCNVASWSIQELWKLIINKITEFEKYAIERICHLCDKVVRIERICHLCDKVVRISIYLLELPGEGYTI